MLGSSYIQNMIQNKAYIHLNKFLSQNQYSAWWQHCWSFPSSNLMYCSLSVGVFSLLFVFSRGKLQGFSSEKLNCVCQHDDRVVGTIYAEYECYCRTLFFTYCNALISLIAMFLMPAKLQSFVTVERAKNPHLGYTHIYYIMYPRSFVFIPCHRTRGLQLYLDMLCLLTLQHLIIFLHFRLCFIFHKLT